MTLHRPSNVDDPAQLESLCEVIAALAQEAPVVFPVHTRTRMRLAAAGDGRGLGQSANIRLTGPLGYLDFVALMAQARLVLTDSGGVQEETTVLGVPCLTVRTTTERPVTVSEGTNRLVDPYDQAAVLAAALETMRAPRRAAAANGARRPELWDGHAADRIAAALAASDRASRGLRSCSRHETRVGLPAGVARRLLLPMLSTLHSCAGMRRIAILIRSVGWEHCEWGSMQANVDIRCEDPMPRRQRLGCAREAL